MINLAKSLRKYLEDNFNDIELPFIHKFPRDCCEITTLLLALSISKYKTNNPYLIAKGYNQTNDSWHYWLESDNKIIDITADQFGRDLLFDTNDSWNHLNFPDYELIMPTDFLSRNEIFLENPEEFIRVISSLKE